MLNSGAQDDQKPLPTQTYKLRKRREDVNVSHQNLNEPRIQERNMLTCCPLCDHTVAVQALLGHLYGGASLPTQVEVSQSQLLLHEGQKAGISTREVERIYQRD